MAITQIDETLAMYEKYLRRNELSPNTIKSYLWTAADFLSNYDVITKMDVLDYKDETYCVKTIRMQSKNFADNIISNQDYRKLIKRLKEDNRVKWYMIVRTLVCTAARISELVNMKVENVVEGYMVVYSKGSVRKIFFPKGLQEELLAWLIDEQRTQGALFLNKNGERISVNGIETMLKKYAREYGIDERSVHPHAFRHRYAINFLENSKSANSLMELADILGHKNLNITRIYTRLTANEQQKLVDKTVTW